jgi:hypothetical protein
MAARYVNPDNIAAQGQSFYTGLHPVQYQSGTGGGGSNVFGAGSGGQAGVTADRSGADAGRAWNYPVMDMKLGGGSDKDSDGRGGSGGITINNVNQQSQQQQQQQNAFGGGFGGGFSPPDEGPIDVPSWREPDAPEPMGELGPGDPIGELEPVKPIGELGPGEPIGELGPGPKPPREPSQTPGAIRKRAKRAKDSEKRDADKAYQEAINPATGGLYRTPHRNVSGPIGASGPGSVGEPLYMADAEQGMWGAYGSSRTKSRSRV